MADTGRLSDRTARSPLKTKIVRSQKILAGSSPTDSRSDIPEESDESSDQRSTPLPRSHTPGHLASKSTHDRRRKPSDLSIRQRSQSASHVSSQASSRPSTSNGAAAASSTANPNRSHALGGDGGGRSTPKRDTDGEPRRPSAMRSTSSILGRATGQLSASSSATASLSTTASRRVTGASHPPAGQHTSFPPLQKPEDAPDVPAAPASGMYWSKAMTSGAPHSNFRAHTTTLIGSNVYVFGGCDSGTCFNDLNVLDADAFYWSVPYLVGDIPMPLRAMTCTAVGKKLVVFGGGDGPSYYNDVYVLDTVNFRWTKPRIVGDKLPSKRRAHTACLYKNGIYVFGGGDGVRALNDIWRLDVSDVNKMSWKLVSSPERTTPGVKDQQRPKARGYHTANMVGSKLIIFGGSDGGECFDDVWVYDVEAHYWKCVDIPATFRRLSHTATVVGSYLFVIGGHDGGEYCSDVLLLNLVTMTWDRRKAYGLAPSGRGYHGTVLYDSRLLVIGGFDGNEVFGDVVTLELAVHAYYSQISHFTIDV